MISILERGFLRRNWGKLALGAGALGFAASRGEDMPIGGLKQVAGTAGESSTDRKVAAIKKMANQLKDKGQTSGTFIGGQLQPKNLDATVQSAARKTGAATRATVDYTRKTADSFKQGYQGSAASPNVPQVKPGPMPPESKPGQFWNKSFRGTGGPAKPVNPYSPYNYMGRANIPNISYRAVS